MCQSSERDWQNVRTTSTCLSRARDYEKICQSSESDKKFMPIKWKQDSTNIPIISTTYHY